LADAIARALIGAEHPVVVSGTGCGNAAIIRAAADISSALCERGRKAGLLFVVPECNSLGLGLMGAGGSLGEAFARVARGGVEAVIILQNDLYRRAGAKAVDAFLTSLKKVIAIDQLHTATTAKADVVLPAGTVAEDEGTFVNNEGRAQRFFRVLPGDGEVQEGWRWLRDMQLAARRPEASEWKTLDDVTAALAREIPFFSPVVGAAPPAAFRIEGMKVPRQPHRSSGRTAMVADATVHEPKPADDPNSPLSFSMEGYEGEPPSSLINRYWAPRWNSVQSLNRYQREVGGALHSGDPGRRLIEPPESAAAAHSGAVPAAFVPRDGELLFVPLHHIFGSDELSALAAAIAELTPGPYVAMHPGDAGAIRAGNGDPVTVMVDDAALQYPLRIDSRLPRGVAGLPVGLPGTAWVELPAWGRVRRDGEGGEP
jgi:NADH-quinone oxidoreductase subunit G